MKLHKIINEINFQFITKLQKLNSDDSIKIDRN